MTRAVCVVLALSWLPWLIGCAGPGYDFEDLPDQPIALVYRNMTEAEQARDAFQKREERLQTARTGRRAPRRQNTLDVDDMAQVFGVYGTTETRAAAALGRLALLDARTGEIQTVDWAQRGSRPLAWSPDHRRLLYIGLRRGAPHVFERNFETGEVRQVTHGRRRHIDAAYCGDDGVIFSAVTPGRGIRLYLREAGGGRPVAVTPGPADYAPSCAPDGSAVYYSTRGPGGVEQIAALDLLDPDAEPAVLTRGRHPSATPDGEWVVYSARTRDGWKVWRMRTDGTGRHPLGRGSEWEHQPSVNGQGRFAVFVSTVDEKEVDFKLWVRPLDGDRDRPLRVDGEGLHPVW